MATLCPARLIKTFLNLNRHLTCSLLIMMMMISWLYTFTVSPKKKEEWKIGISEIDDDCKKRRKDVKNGLFHSFVFWPNHRGFNDQKKRTDEMRGGVGFRNCFVEDNNNDESNNNNSRKPSVKDGFGLVWVRVLTNLLQKLLRARVRAIPTYHIISLLELLDSDLISISIRYLSSVFLLITEGHDQEKSCFSHLILWDF